MRFLRHMLVLAAGVALVATCLPDSSDEPSRPDSSPNTDTDPRCGDTGCVPIPAPFRNDRCGGSCDAEAGLVCAGGRCVCAEGGVVCAGRCVDPHRDSEHCGRCDHGCGGEACLDGVCDCPAGLRMCDEACQPDAYFASHEEHCGACDALCLGTCRDGECLTIVDLAASAANTAVVLSDGSVWIWGDNTFGQLGQPPAGDYDRRGDPQRIEGIDDAVAVGLGICHGCALLADGDVMCWGDAANNAVGPDGVYRFSPAVLVPGLDDVVAISIGDLQSCALTASGRVYTWGSNDHGSLGDGTTDRRAEVALIPGLSDVQELRCAEGATCVRDADGVRCVGNLYYLRGREEALDTLEFAPLSVPSGPIAQFDIDHHLCAVSDGAVYCAGDNRGGQVTDPPSDSAGLSRSRHIVERDPAVEVVTANDSTCALTEGGDVVCWGSNENGQLGHRLDHPVVANTVPLDEPAIDIDGDGMHHCALLDNGELWCWGWNLYQQTCSWGDTRMPEPVRRGWPW